MGDDDDVMNFINDKELPPDTFSEPLKPIDPAKMLDGLIIEDKIKPKEDVIPSPDFCNMNHG